MHKTYHMALVAVLLAIALPAVHGQTRLAIPTYQNPGTSYWNSWAAPGAGAVGLMIVNMVNGDDVKYHSSVDTAIQKARKQGIYVIGYTYTGYATRDPSVIRQRIDAVYQNYLVDGIFFDEVNTDCTAANTYFPNNYVYYQSLTDYVRQKGGAHITVLNPGTYSPDDCYMSITNILVNWENISYSAYQTSYIDYPWVHGYPADRFWHILLGVPQAQMAQAISLAQSRNAGWVYISDSQLDAYKKVPVYWTAEANAVKQQGIQSPYAVSSTGRISFRWHTVGGSVWQIYMDTDQNAGTGYQGLNLGLGAEFLLENNALGDTHLYGYTGSGTEWSWTEVQANVQSSHPDTNVNLVMIDRTSVDPSSAMNYQIRSLDQNYSALYTTGVLPLSLNNTGLVFDILDHP